MRKRRSRTHEEPKEHTEAMTKTNVPGEESISEVCLEVTENTPAASGSSSLWQSLDNSAKSRLVDPATEQKRTSFNRIQNFFRSPSRQFEEGQGAGSNTTILRAEDLHKTYGGREVVKGVSPELRQGEVVGLLGPNGAGKTTTFYLLLGVVKPTAGEVYLNEARITHWPLYERARAGISYLPQESSIFRKLTVRENMQIILDYTDLSAAEQKKRGQELMEELGIARLANQKAAVLSGGERRRLETARALIRNPNFILLDEPFAGIDPLAVDDIQLLVKDLKAKGIGVLISDHNVRETLSICDRAYLVFDGQIIFQGTPTEIVADPRAKRVYLGEDFYL